MSHQLLDFLNRFEHLPQHEAIQILENISQGTLAKGEYFCEEGDLVSKGLFIKKGAVKVFFTDDNGEEHIRYFAFENWWAFDIHEILYKVPTLCSIQALEHTEFYTLDSKNYRELLVTCPVFAKVFNYGCTMNYHEQIKREKEKLSMPPEQVYLKLLDRYPGIDKRITLYNIASYLNIKPESLSRIRKRMKEQGTLV